MDGIPEAQELIGKRIKQPPTVWINRLIECVIYVHVVSIDYHHEVGGTINIPMILHFIRIQCRDW